MVAIERSEPGKTGDNVERRLSISVYVAAFILTAVIFALGIYVGGLINQGTAAGLTTNVEMLSTKLQGFQLLFLLDEENSSLFCSLYAKELGNFEDESEKMRIKIAYLEESKGVADENLKKQYFVLETNAYLLSKKINERCGNKDKLVLYFYSNKDCPSCYQQGIDLFEARQQLEKQGISIKTYAFDGTLDSSIVDALKLKYGVSTYPTIIIDNKILKGHMAQTELVSELLNYSGKQ